MTMQASTLGILEAADFSPKQAHALVRAIEGEIKGSDLLTRPVFEAGIANLKLEIARLDGGFRADLADLNGAFKTESARLEGNSKSDFAEFKGAFTTELARTETRLFNKMIGLGLGATSIIVGAVYFLVLNLKR
jgi:hypothetical protein